MNDFRNLLAGLALIGAGCTPPPTGAPTAQGQTGSTGSVPSRQKPKEAKVSVETEDSLPRPRLSDLPPSLKTDAFAYYGLGVTGPVRMTIASGSKGGASYAGTQTTKLTKITPNEAIFEVTRTDGLAALGSTTLSLRPSGVYVIKTTGSRQKGPTIELPVGLKPGKTWTDSTKLSQPQPISLESTMKVVGTRKVTTPLGTYDALLVASSGKGTLAGAPIRLDTKTWYVKGRGPVKTVLVQTPQGGPPQTITMQEAK